MADKQHNRKPVANDEDFYKERDPLAELARVVGYGDYYKVNQGAAGPEPEIDLEDELLRALGNGGDDRPADDVHGAAAAAPISKAVDDTPVRDVPSGKDAMTLSLEEDLLRELEIDDGLDREIAGHVDSLFENQSLPAAQPDAAPVSTDVPAVADDMATSTDASDEIAAFDAASTQGPSPEAAAQAEEPEEAEGFFFPSADKIETDDTFRAKSWEPYAVENRVDNVADSDVADASKSFEEPVTTDGSGAGPEYIAPMQPVSVSDLPVPELSDRTSAPESGRPDEALPSADHGAAFEADEPEIRAEALFYADPAARQDDDGVTDSHAQGDAFGDVGPAFDIAGASDEALSHESAQSAEIVDEADDGTAASESEAAFLAADGNVEAVEGPVEEPDFELPATAEIETEFDGTTRQSAYADDFREVGSPIGDHPSALLHDGDSVRFDTADVSDDTAADSDVEGATAALEESDMEMPDLDDILREITSDDNAAADATSADSLDAGRSDEFSSSVEPGPVDLSPAPAVGANVQSGAAGRPGERDAGLPAPHPEEASNVVSLMSVKSAVPDAEEGGADVFDPAAIAEHDELVEPIADLDVPALPGDEPEQTMPHEEEEALDYDVDAALAQLVGGSDFTPRVASAMTVDAAEEPQPAKAAAQAVPAAATADVSESVGEHPAFADHFDLDELERALDADLGDTAPIASRGPEAAYPANAGYGYDGPAADVPAPAIWRNWKVLGAGVAVIALVAAGVVSFGLGGPDDAGTGGPRIIAADKAPVKQKPANPGGKTVPNQNKIVYNQVDGTKADVPTQKSLITSNEAPVDVVQRTLRPDLPSDPSMASGEPDGIVPPADEQVASNGAATGAQADSGDGAGVKSEDRLAPGKTAAAPTSAVPSGVMPHYVQTMTVTADGKLKPADPQPAPADAPAGAASGNSAAASAPPPASSSVAPNGSGRSSQAAPAPVPLPRPPHEAQQAAPATPAPSNAAANRPAQPAAEPKASPAPPAAEAEASTASSIRYFVQIASQPTEAGAKASYANLSRQHSSLLGGRGVDIQKATIDGKGVYYRVRIPAVSRDDAIKLCESYRAAGGSCFVAK